MTTIEVKCGWCGKSLGIKDGKGSTGVSHGICQDCAVINFPEVSNEDLD